MSPHPVTIHQQRLDSERMRHAVQCDWHTGGPCNCGLANDVVSRAADTARRLGVSRARLKEALGNALLAACNHGPSFEVNNHVDRIVIALEEHTANAFKFRSEK